METERKKPQKQIEIDSLVEEKELEMSFVESHSITQFLQKGFYKENILAYNDYTEIVRPSFTGTSINISVDFDDGAEITPDESPDSNPYIFFEKVEDGDFDLYQNLIDLPRVSTNSLISPLAVNAFVNYKFYLNTIIIENGQKIYDIIVEPRFSQAPLFSGNLYIIDELWVIKSMDLSINSLTTNYFKDFRIVEDDQLVGGNWVPIRREFVYTINDGPNLVLANTRVNHSNYDFNLEFNDRSFKTLKVIYNEDAFDKDSSYWNEVRPIQLKPEELNYIHEQDSLSDLYTSDAYVDSVNSVYNKPRFWDFILSGVGFRNRLKGRETYIRPLIQQVQPITVGGYRHRIGGFYSKEFDNAKKVKFEGQIDYGFRNKDVKGDLGVEFTFLPKKFGSFEIKGGDIYDFVTVEQSITDFFGVSNQVRKRFFGFNTKYEIVNGLFGRLAFDHSVRSDISNLDYAPWVKDLVERGFWSPPQPYETYRVSYLTLGFTYQFRQQYIIKGNKKLIIGTKFPKLSLSYKWGIPDLLGSNINFNFLELRVSDDVQLATMGRLRWNLEAGSFFGTDLDDIQYVERKFIRGSDGFIFSNPLGTAQRLDSTFNTTRPFVQAYGIHHFNGAVMNKIPLINKLGMELLVGGSSET